MLAPEAREGVPGLLAEIRWSEPDHGRARLHPAAHLPDRGWQARRADPGGPRVGPAVPRARCARGAPLLHSRGGRGASPGPPRDTARIEGAGPKERDSRHGSTGRRGGSRRASGDGAVEADLLRRGRRSDRSRHPRGRAAAPGQAPRWRHRLLRGGRPVRAPSPDRAARPRLARDRGRGARRRLRARFRRSGDRTRRLDAAPLGSLVRHRNRPDSEAPALDLPLGMRRGGGAPPDARGMELPGDGASVRDRAGADPGLLSAGSRAGPGRPHRLERDRLRPRRPRAAGGAARGAVRAGPWPRSDAHPGRAVGLGLLAGEHSGARRARRHPPDAGRLHQAR
jgi:hypothetical protein